MRQFTLYLATKTTSSWSLRGWLACKLAGIDFDEMVIPLDAPQTQAEIAKVSPSGKLPCLHHGDLRIWDSLAIGEYLAELRPDAHLWPADRAARAHARSIAAEMHSGFQELRRNMWMHLKKGFPGKGQTPGALADIARVGELWRDTRRRYGADGPFLFGARFNLADAFFAPVASRFVTWEPEIPRDTHDYVAAVMAHRLVAEWVAAAQKETIATTKYDVALD